MRRPAGLNSSTMVFPLNGGVRATLSRALIVCSDTGRPMRHYPAYCSDCKRLWLGATEDVPSASPICPRCKDRGRLVPGAYYSDPASLVFNKLEAAVVASGLDAVALARLGVELERLLPSPTELEIEQTFADVMRRIGL